MQSPRTSTLPSVAVRARIRGIDMARALAIVGMVMVHVGPQGLPGGGVFGAAYRASHGRASIGFIVLAGIGVSLLAGDRSAGRIADGRARLAWRAMVLFPAGIALQTLDINVAVILQYYAAFFVAAALAIRLDDRALLGIAALSATLGPVVLVALAGAVPGWFQPGVPAWHEAGRIVRDVALTGYYPVVVWTAPLLVGMWIGRRDLHTRSAAWRMVAGGAGAAALGFVVSEVLVTLGGPAASASDWRVLYVVEPHNEMPLWVLTSTGVAVAVTGACIVGARVLPRLAWPWVALGQLALTVYVGHLLVLEVWPQWLLRDTFAGAWLSVARFTAVALVVATAYRAVASHGPLELLLRPGPRMLALPRSTSRARTTAARDPIRSGDGHGRPVDGPSPAQRGVSGHPGESAGLTSSRTSPMHRPSTTTVTDPPAPPPDA